LQFPLQPVTPALIRQMTAKPRPRSVIRDRHTISARHHRSPLCLLALAAALIATTAMAPSIAAAAVKPPELDWQRCTDPTQQGLICATAQVPLNYNHPHRRKIHLAVVKHPAADPEGRVGTLFFNPGGPAESISDFPTFLNRFFPEQVKNRFDIVTWDPRGTGESTAVQCFDSKKAEERFLKRVGEPASSFPVGRSEKDSWIRTYRRFDRRCGERNRSLLRHVSSAESARDLNLLRRAVGERRLNYWGISYGTFLGATYANLFPTQVRAVILDGDLNPRAWVHRQLRANRGEFLDTWLRQHSDQGAAKTLGAFLDLCGSANTAHCAFSAGSAAKTRAKFDRLLARLRRNPASANVTYAQLASKSVSALYYTFATGPDGNEVDLWSGWAQMLQQVWKTGELNRPLTSPAAPSLSALAPGARPAATGTGAGARERYAGIEQQLAIVCAESPNPRPGAYRSLDRFAYDRSGPAGSFWLWSSEPCASWPATAPDRYSGPWDRRTANPILVIGNTHDPATPYRGAKAMSRLLARARLLTVEGYGHTALTNPSTCAYRYASRYLIDKALPPKGTRCAQDMQPFAEAVQP
jgi:pimeloyl-ACP methyl ester carboxylesterase